jgi:flagellar protein FliJ
MFKFSLEPVLNKHKLEEEQIQKDLAAAARKLHEQRVKLREIEEERADCISELDRRSRNGMQVSDMTAFISFIDSLAVNIKTRQKEVDRAAAVLEGMRSALVEVFKKRKVLERFKEKRMSEYSKSRARQEEKILNEIAVQAYLRRNSAGIRGAGEC